MIKFIPKVSTKAAIAYLNTEWEKEKKNSSAFRIVSDMTRLNEKSSKNAGARFAKKLRELGF
jgi:hypothetical protein